MVRRPATISDANAANHCADAAARRNAVPRSVFLFALLLLYAPLLHPQAILGTTTGVTNPLTINSNNSSGIAYNAVLASDSSVSLMQNGAVLSGQSCPAFSTLSSISSGAVYVDSVDGNIYLAMVSGGVLYAAYESIDQTSGVCTQGPLLELTTNALSNLEMNVDPTVISSQQGNVYVLNSYGAFPDMLYILPTAPWSALPLPTPTTLTMDYSVQYGPIVIDPSNHQVYVNDLGGSTSGTVGTYATSGFFVYAPNQSTTPANNLQHVVGYNSSGTTTVLNVGTLLDNHAGKLVLVNENPNASTVNLTVPITILDTTEFSFFTNTTKPFSYNNDVDITPGIAGISTISASAPYEAISGADIDTVNQVVYAYAFNIPNSAQPGMLLKYNLSSTVSPQETVLSSAVAKPSLYGSLAPWSELNYNPESTELVLSVGSEFGSGALGLTSQLCAGTSLTLTQLFGSASAPTPLDYPIVNSVSGYTYAIQPAPTSVVNFVAPPAACTTSTSIQISPTTLVVGFPGESYFESLSATGGSGTGYLWSVTSGTALSAVGLSLTSAGVISGTPNATETAAPFTVQVIDSQGNIGTQDYTLTIYPDISIAPSSLPSGTVGTPYSQTITATGGSGGPFTFTVVAGTALSAVGLSLSPGGAISGTPTGTETAAALTVQIVDSQGDNTRQNYTLTVNASTSTPAQVTDLETITVTDTDTFPDISDNESITVSDIDTVRAYNAIVITPSPASFNASSGTGIASETYAPVTFSAMGGIGTLTLSESGTLPAGLTFTNGVLGGTLLLSSAGTYTFSVTATDADGDQATQQGYTLNIAAPPPPSLRLTVNPDSLAIVQGQTGVTTLTFTPTGGYTGTLGLSCSGLPANSLCVFSENGAPIDSVVLTGNDQPVSITLTFETNVNIQQAEMETTPPPSSTIWSAIAFWWSGSLLGLAALKRKRLMSAKGQRWLGLWLLLFTAAVAEGLSGCGSNSGFGTYVTPIGNSTVTVSASSASGATQTLSIDITITH